MHQLVLKEINRRIQTKLAIKTQAQTDANI